MTFTHSAAAARRAIVALALLAAPALVTAQPITKDGASRAAHAAAPTTVILVRHADRGTEPANDPVITPAGQERAKRLVPVLKDAGVDAILTTQFQRTKLTAQPTAEALGITPETVAASGRDHPQAVARHIREKLAGRTVLVVGHSNTINAIAAALGAPHPGEIEDSVYDNLYIVTVLGEGKAKLIKARF
jgi:broad specificity phosphatase PhoE